MVEKKGNLQREFFVHRSTVPSHDDDVLLERYRACDSNEAVEKGDSLSEKYFPPSIFYFFM